MNALEAISPGFDESLMHFRSNADVQAILVVAALWDGKTVRGDLVALARTYHRLVLVHKSELIVPFVPDWVRDLEGGRF